MIHRQLYPDLDLIIHTIVGEMTASAYRSAIASLYTLDSPPRLSLWDFSDGIVHSFLQEMKSEQGEASLKVRGRAGGKTAVIAPSNVMYGLARQYVTLAESLGLPIEQAVFRTRAEALNWLVIDREKIIDGVALEPIED